MRLPRRASLVLFLLLVVLVGAEGRARAGGPEGKVFGIGVCLPEPAAFTFEAYVSHASAIDFSVGWDTFSNENGYGHFDYLVYPVDLARGGTVSLPFYLGLGVWLRDVHKDVDVGVRVPLGLAINFHDAPLQIFGELAVKVILASADDNVDRVDLDGDVGFRLFF
jgi:hypothetical protein